MTKRPEKPIRGNRENASKLSDPQYAHTYTTQVNDQVYLPLETTYNSSIDGDPKGTQYASSLLVSPAVSSFLGHNIEL